MPTTAIFIRKKSRLVFVFTLFLFGICGAIAQEKAFPEFNCAITPPAGWHQMTNVPPQKAFCAAFGNASKSRLLMLIILDKYKTSAAMNDQIADEIERGFESSGMGKRDSGRFVDIAGIKSYERTGHSLVKGKNASTITQVVLADGRFYSLQAMWLDGDASQDSEIREALTSFRFITPPSFPDRAFSSGYRVGYIIGRYVPIVALGIGATVAVLTAILRQRTAKTRQTPPSIPPNVQP